MKILASRDFSHLNRVVQLLVTEHDVEVIGNAQYKGEDLTYIDNDHIPSPIGWSMTLEDFNDGKLDRSEQQMIDEMLQTIADEVQLRWASIEFND